MTLLSLDLSTKRTGYAIFKDKKLLLHGYFSATSTDVINRIKKMTVEIKQLIQEYQPKKIIIEEVRPDDEKMGNLHTHKVLMWLQAAIEFMVHDDFSGTAIEYIYPSEWRKECGIATGRGIKRESLKAADIAFVAKTYQVTTDDDQADAICIGHAAIQRTKISTGINWE